MCQICKKVTQLSCSLHCCRWGIKIQWLCLSLTLAWGLVVTTCVVLIKKHSPNNVITMWPCSDLYTHRLRVRQSQRTKYMYSHTCMERHAFVSKAYQRHAQTQTPHIHTLTHSLTKPKTEGSKRHISKPCTKRCTYISKYTQTKSCRDTLT